MPSAPPEGTSTVVSARRVRIDGTVIGQTPLPTQHLEPGRHEFRASRSGCAQALDVRTVLLAPAVALGGQPVQKVSQGFAAVVDIHKETLCPKFSCCTVDTFLSSDNKKTDVAEYPEAFNHVGLLSNEPPGTAELLFT